MSARTISLLRVGVVAALAAAAPVHAQTVRGVVADLAEKPVTGVVVQLVDSVNVVVARTLSNLRGEYRLTSPRAGTFRLRTLRIGFRPSYSEAIRLAAGQEATRRLALTGPSFSLDTVRVASRNSCEIRKDSSAMTFRVWEQVRTALSAAQATGDARIASTTLGFERIVDPDSYRIMHQSSRVANAYVNQPWLSQTPDTLREFGYVRLNPDLTTMYYAPGLEVLLSEQFMEDHCFRLTGDSSRIGVVFDAAPHREKVSELRGTMWLDRRTSQLRTMDFGYANVLKVQQERAGGTMDFISMRDGTWAISQWSIRMPALEESRTSSSSGGTTRSTVVGARVLGMVIAGGELVLALRGNDTLFQQPPRVLRGTVTDSITGRPEAGAFITLGGTLAQSVSDDSGRFTMTGVLPGSYTINVNTTALDAFNAQHRTSIAFNGLPAPISVRVPSAVQVAAALCGKLTMHNPGIVLGHLGVRGDSAAPRDLRVLAQWTSLDSRPGEGASSERINRMESRVDSRGTFRFCGVPTNTVVRLAAESDSGVAAPMDLTIPADARFSRAEIDFDWKVRAGATLLGTVVADSTFMPIAGAEVVLVDLGKSFTTGDSGTFRIADVPVGTHKFAVRRFGFGPLEAELTIAGRNDIARRVVLTRNNVTLARVVTTESAVPPSFEENRRRGMGTFFLPEELRKWHGRKLGSLLEGRNGVNVLHGRGGQNWVQGKRPLTSGCTTQACIRQEKRLYWPTTSERAGGMPIACFAQVFLDKTLMNPGLPTQPYDINSLVPEMIAGMEFYANEAQTPTEFRRGSLCGALVIWSRRGP